MRADAFTAGKHIIICELSKITYIYIYIEGAIWIVPQCTVSQGTQTSPTYNETSVVWIMERINIKRGIHLFITVVYYIGIKLITN